MIAVVAPMHPDPSAEIVTVTPEQALEWLETFNTHNRSVRQGFVNKLAGAIRRGEWVFNGAPIGFDVNGVLVDGQHRLWACVEADMPIQTTIVRGLDVSAQLTIDTGLRRSLDDSLRLNGVKSSRQTAAALSILWRMESGRVMSTDGPTIQQGLELLERNPGLPEAVHRADTWRKHVGISGSVLAVVYHHAQDLDAEDAEDFFGRLASGADLPVDDPRFIFRRYAARKRSSRTIVPQWQDHALLIKAWNAYRQGRKMSNLSFRAGGATPESFPEMV